MVAELLEGLTRRGHEIDCFFPGEERELPRRFGEIEKLTFVWGTSSWRWNRWYSRTKIAAFATGLISRALASVRLRQEIVRRHRLQPYDLIFQNGNIESLSVPPSVAREVPFVTRADTHVAGELRFLLKERRLALRCQPLHTWLIAVATMSLRALVQRVQIRRVRLLICISSVFRDHVVHDYGFPLERTVVVPNPVRLDRFADVDTHRSIGHPAIVLVLGRIAVRKGVEDLAPVARALLARNVDARLRVIGGPSLWSDYTKLLDDLPPENTEYVGRIPPSEIPGELAGGDIVLQPSTYEPFALTVSEGLAAGVPVVATSEVGAIEGVDRAVVAEVRPGDVGGMARAIAELLTRLERDPGRVRGTARAEAERLFAPEVVCEKISSVLELLVAGEQPAGASSDR